MEFYGAEEGWKGGDREGGKRMSRPDGVQSRADGGHADIDMEDVHRTRRAIPTSVQRRLDLYSLQTVRGDAGDGSPAASVK